MAEYVCEECGGTFAESEIRDVASPDWAKSGDRKLDWMCCRSCEERMKAEEPERFRKLSAPTEADLAGETTH